MFITENVSVCDSDLF